MIFRYNAENHAQRTCFRSVRECQGDEWYLLITQLCKTTSPYSQKLQLDTVSDMLKECHWASSRAVEMRIIPLKKHNFFHIHEIVLGLRIGGWDRAQTSNHRRELAIKLTMTELGLTSPQLIPEHYSKSLACNVALCIVRSLLQGEGHG